ncbi:MULTISPECIES: SIMPL domain-containing protein [unclassified Leifsonia]|uniref:SIMPL domain-containing protein n=1 Tax=unclassified Leifsonia TaxID=2663824 RepID=UPI0009267124|nr:SIMPL domain-containing protein [Leifsonia sp. 71-9]OJX75021.1 MAG: SIMPL domain-containing protein [Leifsonia sp. 71-9]
MSETMITVQGEHEERRAAERGTVRLLVTYDGESRHETLALATERQAELAAGLREIQNADHGPVLRWSSDQLRVWGDRPWSQSGEQLPIVHHAQVGIEAEFADTAVLSDWVGTVSLRDGVTVEGVTWSLADDTLRRLTEEVSQRAVEEAVAKARRYASGLGLSALRPVALSDPGLLGDAGAPLQPAPPFAARMMSADAGGAALALKPDEIRVAVQVHARFAAS